MLIKICSRFVVLMCLLSLVACTTTSVIYPKSTSKDSSRSWLEHVKVGDQLELVLKDSSTIKIAVAEVTADTIKGDNGVSVLIPDIVSAKTKRFSWIKTTLLTIGVLAVICAAAIAHSVSNMGDISGSYGEHTNIQ